MALVIIRIRKEKGQLNEIWQWKMTCKKKKREEKEEAFGLSLCGAEGYEKRQFFQQANGMYCTLTLQLITILSKSLDRQMDIKPSAFVNPQALFPYLSSTEHTEF